MRTKVTFYTLLLGLCLITAVSCDRNEPDSVSIGFDDVVTKALVTSEGDLRSGAIGILGTKTVTSSGVISSLFGNTRLYHNGSTWTYDDTRYWIPGNTYDFVAIYPYDGAVYPYYTCNVNAKSITFSYTSSLGVDQKDVMYSYHHRVYAAGGDHSPVPLTMQHACSSLNFQVQNASGVTISLSDIYLTGLYNNGSCTLNCDAYWNPNASWSVSGAKIAVDNTTTYPGKTSGLSNLAVSTTKYEMFNESILVVPQDVLGNTDIILHAHVTPQSGSAYDISAVLANTIEVPDWEPGKHYIYTLTIASTNITFDVELLPWIDDIIEL